MTTGNSSAGIPRGGINDEGNSFKKLAHYVKANYFIPDARIGWNRFALQKAKKIITEPDNTIIISTGPPHSTHLIGYQLKCLYQGLTWVCDFRDPWLELYSNMNAPQNSRSKKKNKHLEQKVLQHADQVITVGPSLVRLLQTKLPISKMEKVTYFYNGFDAAKMNQIPAENPRDFVITFIGLIPEDYQVEGFIFALQKFSAVIDSRPVVLRLAGNIVPSFIHQLNQISSITVDYKGFVSHNDSLKLMKSASLLFTILPTQKFDEIIISGKMMEYIASRKPILCIGNKMGDAAKLIDKTQSGFTFSSDEVDPMSHFITTCYKQEFKVSETIPIQNYSRESITKKLYHFLKGL